MSQGEHSASEDSVAAIHQHPQHWKKEILMADQKKPILEPTTQAFVDALAAQEESRCMSFRMRTRAESWKTRRP
jgi:hypothetical protein